MLDPKLVIVPATQGLVIKIPVEGPIVGTVHDDNAVFVPATKALPDIHKPFTNCPTAGAEQFAITVFVPRIDKLPEEQIVTTYDPTGGVAQMAVTVLDPNIE